MLNIENRKKVKRINLTISRSRQLRSWTARAAPIAPGRDVTSGVGESRGATDGPGAL